MFVSGCCWDRLGVCWLPEAEACLRLYLGPDFCKTSKWPSNFFGALRNLSYFSGMKLHFASVLLIALLTFSGRPAWAQTQPSQTQLSQTQPWPKNEYGNIQLMGTRVFEGEQATRRSFQQRVQTWFKTNLEPTRLVEDGRLSARGEFYGWGRFAPVKVGTSDYQLLLGVAARLVEEEGSYRIEDMKCRYQLDGKPVVMPLEMFLESTNPEHKLAATVFRKRLDQFIAAL